MEKSEVENLATQALYKQFYTVNMLAERICTYILSCISLYCTTCTRLTSDRSQHGTLLSEDEKDPNNLEKKSTKVFFRGKTLLARTKSKQIF
jgi:hypothetical protein